MARDGLRYRPGTPVPSGNSGTVRDGNRFWVISAVSPTSSVNLDVRSRIPDHRTRSLARVNPFPDVTALCQMPLQAFHLARNCRRAARGQTRLLTLRARKQAFKKTQSAPRDLRPSVKRSLKIFFFSHFHTNLAQPVSVSQ